MKRFYYTDRAEKGHKDQRCNHVLRIYKLVNKDMIFLDESEYSTASTPGAESEVFRALIRIGEIPRKWYNSSENSWRGPGYYGGPVMKYYNIKEIY